MLEKIFKLKENNTTAKTEIIAGLTTFMTMAYIIALNPNLLTGFGKDTMPELWNGVFLATCIASAIGTIVMAFLANKPFAMAPGMGLNSFFAVVVINIVALTGLTALTTGIMFLACIFIAPIAGIIPAAATSSALIYVGVLMVAGLKNVDFDDICQSLPVALMMIDMPISGSIGHAIGLGLITYTVIKVFTGKAKDVSVLTYVLSLIFLLKFFIVA